MIKCILFLWRYSRGRFAAAMALTLVSGLSGIMLLSWIVPKIVTALAWKSIYDPIFGVLSSILMGLGIGFFVASLVWVFVSGAGPGAWRP